MLKEERKYEMSLSQRKGKTPREKGQQQGETERTCATRDVCARDIGAMADKNGVLRSSRARNGAGLAPHVLKRLMIFLDIVIFREEGCWRYAQAEWLTRHTGTQIISVVRVECPLKYSGVSAAHQKLTMSD